MIWLFESGLLVIKMVIFDEAWERNIRVGYIILGFVKHKKRFQWPWWFYWFELLVVSRSSEVGNLDFDSLHDILVIMSLANILNAYLKIILRWRGTSSWLWSDLEFWFRTGFLKRVWFCVYFGDHFRRWRPNILWSSLVLGFAFLYLRTRFEDYLRIKICGLLWCTLAWFHFIFSWFLFCKMNPCHPFQTLWVRSLDSKFFMVDDNGPLYDMSGIYLGLCIWL